MALRGDLCRPHSGDLPTQDERRTEQALLDLGPRSAPAPDQVPPRDRHSPANSLIRGLGDAVLSSSPAQGVLACWVAAAGEVAGVGGSRKRGHCDGVSASDSVVAHSRCVEGLRSWSCSEGVVWRGALVGDSWRAREARPARGWGLVAAGLKRFRAELGGRGRPCAETCFQRRLSSRFLGVRRGLRRHLFLAWPRGNCRTRGFGGSGSFRTRVFPARGRPGTAGPESMCTATSRNPNR